MLLPHQENILSGSADQSKEATEDYPNQSPKKATEDCPNQPPKEAIEDRPNRKQLAFNLRWPPPALQPRPNFLLPAA